MICEIAISWNGQKSETGTGKGVDRGSPSTFSSSFSLIFRRANFLTPLFHFIYLFCFHYDYFSLPRIIFLSSSPIIFFIAVYYHYFYHCACMCVYVSVCLCVCSCACACACVCVCFFCFVAMRFHREWPTGSCPNIDFLLRLWSLSIVREATELQPQQMVNRVMGFFWDALAILATTFAVLSFLLNWPSPLVGRS